ncbi:MAG: ribonuclease P protein component 1 [Candidatus Aenigmarchaeota archaeon]|nr:ribonuclease P protein component 1 [Candidatus Aenigmarchaeota archaeon]
MITPENIVRHELIGLLLEVKESSNPKSVGIRGEVIDETRNTFIIEKRDKKEITLTKSECKFVFTLPDRKRVIIDGSILVSRPEDRIKKRFEKW